MDTVQFASQLRQKLSTHLPGKLIDSGVIIDLADIREIAIWSKEAIERLANENLSREEIETIFVEMDVQLLFHMRYHLRSLIKKIPKVLNSLG